MGATRMPRKLPTDLNDQIISQIARHPGGLALGPLASSLADVVSRRTLQRRLRNLVHENSLAAEGRGKARVYRLPPSAKTKTTEAGGTVTSHTHIGL